MKLSLRAIGLYSLLETPKTLEEILTITTDSEALIESAWNELLKNEKVEETSGKYLRTTNTIDHEYQKRIRRMFGVDRVYSIIIWWFASLIETLEIDIDFGSDAQLRDLVESEFVAANDMKSWNNTELYDAFKLMEKTMDKNETTQPSLSRLFDYTKRPNR